jgi:nucleotide-binding universal stress UspA family protein
LTSAAEIHASKFTVYREVQMYEHILVPTDGSRLSNAAVEKTLAFAKEVGARRYLASAANRAKITGVQCDTLTVWHEHVYQAIIDTAAAKVCDLISMASHGRRRGLTAMVKAGQGQGQRTVGQTLG